MNKMSIFALSAMAILISCSEKGPLDYPSQRDLEEMAAMSSSSSGGSSSSTWEQSSSSEEVSSSSSEEGSSSSISGCGNYNEENEFCHNSQIYSKCGDAYGIGKSEYAPVYYFCRNNYLYAKCGGMEYEPQEGDVCKSGVVGKECKGIWYKPSESYCLNNELYSKL